MKVTKKELIGEIHKLRQRVIGLEMGAIKLIHGDKIYHRMPDKLTRMIGIEGGVLSDPICGEGKVN